VALSVEQKRKTSKSHRNSQNSSKNHQISVQNRKILLGIDLNMVIDPEALQAKPDYDKFMDMIAEQSNKFETNTKIQRFSADLTKNFVSDHRICHFFDAIVLSRCPDHNEREINKLLNELRAGQCDNVEEKNQNLQLNQALQTCSGP
jgi:glycyl-tRNA synthetase (class II)